MISDEKDENDLELEAVSDTDSPSDGSDDDIIDLGVEESPSSGLSAEPVPGIEEDLESDLDIDITGDENIDFADEDDGNHGRGNGKLKKMLAPALVLVAAAGIGGYIVMNPQILGGGDVAALPEPANPYVAQMPESDPFAAPQENTQDITENTDFAAADDMFATAPPQPTVNQNEMPRPPESDITEVAAAADEPVIPEFPAVTEEVVEVAEVVQDEVVEPIVSELPVMEEEGSADQPAEVNLAEEASSLADDLLELKFTKEDAADVEPAGLTPMEDEPVLFEEPVQEVESNVEESESFEIAQADITDAPDAEPPAMPVTEKPEPIASSVRDQGTAAVPVTPSETVKPAADVYYDGLVPTGPMATEIGPRKIDPVVEPASQLVVVKKAHEATDSEALLVSANRALKLKRYDSALDMFEKLYAKNARDQRILMGLAVAQQNSGLAESAIKTYEELLDINPKNTDAMLNMLGLIRKQYPSVALRRLMDLHDKHPNNAGVAAQIGVTQADLGHYEDAMRYLGTASSLEPNNAQHVFNMAITADRNGDTRNAISHYEKALELDAIYSSGRAIPRESVYDRLSTLRRR